jgi:hypothetical protein
MARSLLSGLAVEGANLGTTATRPLPFNSLTSGKKQRNGGFTNMKFGAQECVGPTVTGCTIERQTVGR